MAILDQLWPTLHQSKHNSIILNLLVEKYQKYNRRINLLIVIASSSSIGAWAIWKEYPFIWSSIIVASQVATVIKPYFPYSKYITELNAKCPKIDVITTELEFLYAQQETANDVEIKGIETEYKSLKRQLNKILEFSDDLLLDISGKTKRDADQRLKSYLKQTWDVEC